MSSDSLALFRKSLGHDLGTLADEHYKHDLQESDRQTLLSAAKNVSLYTTIGSLTGLTLGLFLAYRLRVNRRAMFTAFRAKEKPTHVQFAGGRTEPIPDLTPLLRPSTLGDVAAVTFFAGGGVFFGGELGLLGGSSAAKRQIVKDEESRKRIEWAWKRFRVDMLRTEARALESGEEEEVWGSNGVFR